MSNINETLAERGARYGEFKEHARCVGQFIEVFETSPNWKDMRYDSAQALRVIADKMARMLNGDPEYDDNWRDIIGYATLVLNRIEKETKSNSKSSSSPIPAQTADWQYEEVPF